MQFLIKEYYATRYKQAGYLRLIRDAQDDDAVHFNLGVKWNRAKFHLYPYLKSLTTRFVVHFKRREYLRRKTFTLTLCHTGGTNKEVD